MKLLSLSHWLLAIVCLAPTLIVAQEQAPLPPAAATILKQAKQLLAQSDVSNAVILLESQLPTVKGNREYLDTVATAYQQQFTKLQQEGKMPQASAVWTKLQVLQPELAKHPAPATPTAPAPATTPTPVVAKQTPPVIKTSNSTDPLQAADAAFAQGQFQQACDCYSQVEAQGKDIPEAIKEKYAYCKLRKVAERLNTLKGNPGADRPQMEHEVRQALALAPRLEFGNELLRKLTLPTPPMMNGVNNAATRVRHLPNKDQGWSVCETTHFRIYHQDNQMAEQVAERAEATRAAVIRKWLVNDYTWNQPCQIYVHPTADSYHRQSGMPTTAPGHSDYDADKHDASVIHYRRVFVRADHPHMLNAILPHEVTHVVLNGQFGRKLLPRWADEGMAVLSEPYTRIEMHLEPLARTYQEGRALGVQELLSVQDYPADRSKVASFYGQSVCLVELLTNLKGPQAFVSYMRDANREGDAAALQRHYQLTIDQLDVQLRDWIVSKQMPTLYRVAGR
jgi:tetratricopeptide (TPR) repeat protein